MSEDKVSPKSARPDFGSEFGSKLKDIDIKKRMLEISGRGFIETKRVGDTGVGYTLEEELGIAENNRKMQDLIYNGKEVELKAQRSSTTSNVTLFSIKPTKPSLDDKTMVTKYGFIDKKNRNSLYVTLRANKPNPQGLMLKADRKNDKLFLSHLKDGDLWFWDFKNLQLKIERLLFVVAEVKKVDKKEFFHYAKAEFLTDFNKDRFLELVERGKVVVDMRMYLKKSGAVRDHGIAFRGKFKDFRVCYTSKESIIDPTRFTQSKVG